MFFKGIQNLKVEMKPAELAKASSLQGHKKSAMAIATGQQPKQLLLLLSDIQLLEHSISVRPL